MNILRFLLFFQKQVDSLCIFSIILSIVKYLHRLENTSNALLKEAYCLSKALQYKGIQT